ncbi:MAG: RnfABCDGE type electron transport complex subunit B [Bacteroidales bacterium]|nr:RnfABCDGE type electron transport complex subunit B [Bacteroidales bacterium]
MNQIVLLSIGVLAAIGIVAAILLYFVAQKFKVYEDPMIAVVAELLPGANCGGCGFAGCRNFAENIVKNKGLNGKMCPAGGAPVNEQIAKLFGGEVGVATPKRLVLRCNGSCENAPAKTQYDSITSCAFANMITAGESACMYGCLGCGDCTKACKFGALHINPATGLPEVDAEKCVACGACVNTCPRKLLALVPMTEQGIVWVACANKERGVDAKKNCAAACIGCMKCVKNCENEAIKVTDNLAQINEKCIACHKCEEGCPAKAIHSINA